MMMFAVANLLAGSAARPPRNVQLIQQSLKGRAQNWKIDMTGYEDTRLEKLKR